VLECEPFRINEIPSLNSKQITYLRGLGHHLHPVVSIGNNGLTEQVMNEIETALNAHELIKIKVAGDDRALRVQMLEDICQQTNASAIHHIGKQLVIYRASEKAKITLP
jgi:RNA-binding protein